MASMDFLGKVALTSSSVTISAIPTTYRNLRVYFYYQRGTTSPTPYGFLRLNDVTTDSYKQNYLGDIAGVQVKNSFSDTRVALHYESYDTTSDLIKHGIIDLYSANRTQDKSGHIYTGTRGFEQFQVTGFRADINTAITSITLLTGAGSFTRGYAFLYGME